MKTSMTNNHCLKFIPGITVMTREFTNLKIFLYSKYEHENVTSKIIPVFHQTQILNLTGKKALSKSYIRSPKDKIGTYTHSQTHTYFSEAAVNWESLRSE